MAITKSADIMLGPASAGDEPRKPKRLAGTGATEDVTDTALAVAQYATILVGAVAVRFTLSANATATGQVATTDPIIPAYGRFDWLVGNDTIHAHVEAADGTTAYEAWVWTSSI